MPIVDTIGNVGGETTRLYPNGNGGNYDLEIQDVTGSWKFRITQSA